MPRGAAERGMTLVEMLVVLAIIGIASGAVVLGIGVGARGAGIAAEAERLAGRLRLATDAAIIDDRAVGFSWDARGYRFAALDGGTVPASDAGLAPHSLPAGMTLRVEGAASPVRLGIDGGAAALVARIVAPGGTWVVRSDGLHVTAAPET